MSAQGERKVEITPDMIEKFTRGIWQRNPLWQKDAPPNYDKAQQIVKEEFGQVFLAFVPSKMSEHDVLGVVFRESLDYLPLLPKIRERVDAFDWQLLTMGTGSKLTIWEGVREFPMPFAIAPIRLVSASVVYHVTHESKLADIEKEGLLLSNEERRFTDFPDTDGKIGVYSELEGEFKSARLFRKLLSEHSERPESELVTFRIDLREVPTARIHLDFHTEGGLIVDKIPGIPWRAITRVEE